MQLTARQAEALLELLRDHYSPRETARHPDLLALETQLENSIAEPNILTDAFAERFGARRRTPLPRA